MALMVLSIALLIASVTDLRRREIPNWLVAGAALAGLWIAGAEGRVLSALACGLLAASPFLVAALLRPAGMGMGDVKLVGVLGIFLGSGVWAALAVGLALAGLTGCLISLGRRLPPAETMLPLAPFLALGVGMILAVTGGALQ